MTVDEALRRGTERLAAAGITTPAWDAELLLRHVLGWDRASLLARGSAALDSDQQQYFLALVEERAGRQPLQHLTGVQPFWRHDFLVGPDVLIPRPETELIVEAGLSLLLSLERPVIVDVGTGSGAIALSLAAERPDAEVHAIELSAPALAVAQENARRLGLASRVAFHHGDLLAPVAELAGRIDLVASNPPYVDRSDALTPEVRDHEPAAALFAPGDRYSIYRRLAPEARRLLRPGGFLLLEVGLGMAEEVRRLCVEAGLEVVRVIPDLQQIPRTVVARYPEPGLTP